MTDFDLDNSPYLAESGIGKIFAWIGKKDLVEAIKNASKDPLFKAYQMVNPGMDSISIYEKYVTHKNDTFKNVKSQEDFDNSQDASEPKSDQVPASNNKRNPGPSRKMSDYEQFDVGWETWTIFVPKSWNTNFFLRKWEDWKMKLFRFWDSGQPEDDKFVREFHVFDTSEDWSITLPNMTVPRIPEHSVNRARKKAQLSKYAKWGSHNVELPYWSVPTENYDELDPNSQTDTYYPKSEVRAPYSPDYKGWPFHDAQIKSEDPFFVPEFKNWPFRNAEIKANNPPLPWGTRIKPEDYVKGNNYA